MLGSHGGPRRSTRLNTDLYAVNVLLIFIRGERKEAVYFSYHPTQLFARQSLECAKLKQLRHLSQGEHMGTFSGAPANPGGPYAEHREVPRFTFIAHIELREPRTDMRITGRISEISRKGCYVDVLVTLPVGTGLHMRISCDQGSFETKSKVVYVQEGMGMGVTFVDPPADQLKILDEWLTQLSS